LRCLFNVFFFFVLVVVLLLLLSGIVWCGALSHS
jgi:hypothetical protein